MKTVCPTSTTLTPGIDVSKWQGRIDWVAVQRSGGAAFAITRVSHGLSRHDAFFKDNWRGIRAQGLVRGAYQYFDPRDDPIAQADLLLAQVAAAGGPEPTDLPPALDLESAGSMSAAAIQRRALQWLRHVEISIGVRPMVYCSASFAETYLGVALAAYPLWIANYKYTTSGKCPLLPDGAWSRWTIWQYSNRGSVPGIGGEVDLNVFDGSRSRLEQFIADSSRQKR